MSTGEVLDRTFNLYRSNFILFFGIGLLAPVVELLAELAMLGPTRNGSSSTAAAPILSAVVFSAAWLTGYVFSQGATVYAVSAVHLGRETSIKECYARLRGKILRVFGLVLFILVSIVLGALLIIWVGFTMARFIGLSAEAALIWRSLSVVTAGVYAIYLSLRLAVAVPACVLEDLKIIESVRRSSYLTKGDRRRIFIIYFLFVVLLVIVTLTLMGVAEWMAQSVSGPNSILSKILEPLATFVADAFIGPIAAIAIALIYYDERVRKEAFDLQVMMTALDKPSDGVASAATSVKA
jgi:hypothetical protein